MKTKPLRLYEVTLTLGLWAESKDDAIKIGVELTDINRGYPWDKAWVAKRVKPPVRKAK